MPRSIAQGLERPADEAPSGPGRAPLRIEPPAATPSAGDPQPNGSETASTGLPDLTSLVADLRAALGELKCLGSERLRRHGVSMGHLHAMALLERHGRLSMSHLAELLDVGLSNVTGLVDRMEERGLVERIRVPDDRRLVLVTLTDYGRRLLEEMDLLRNDLLTRVLAQLEPESLAAVSVAVSRLRDVVREAVAEARAEVVAAQSPPDTGGGRGQRHHRRS